MECERFHTHKSSWLDHSSITKRTNIECFMLCHTIEAGLGGPPNAPPNSGFDSGYQISILTIDFSGCGMSIVDPNLEGYHAHRYWGPSAGRYLIYKSRNNARKKDQLTSWRWSQHVSLLCPKLCEHLRKFFFTESSKTVFPDHFWRSRTQNVCEDSCYKAIHGDQRGSADVNHE